MLILGCDVATSSGFCWMDTARPAFEWIATSVAIDGCDTWEEKYGELALWLRPKLDERRPDFAILETPRRDVAGFEKKDEHGNPTGQKSMNPDALQLSGLAGAAVATFALLGIPYGTIAINSWRPAAYGKGVKPRAGEDWKDLAIRYCQTETIQLPMTKKGARDAAEAVGIARAWRTGKVNVPHRFQKDYMALVQGHGRVR